MKVSASHSYYNNNSGYQVRNARTFGHHPDFDRMIKNRPLCFSDYFRRDNSRSGPQTFLDIVALFRKVLTEKSEPLKMLIVGIANSQEPFSYLATIKQLVKNKPIKDVLDLHIIDLQSKPNKDKLFDDAFTMDEIPFYAKDSFVFDSNSRIALCNYRVNDELLEFLNETYEDFTKCKWESRVQEAEYPKNYFDIVSVNNVLYYIPDNQIIPAFDNLCNAVKPGGYIITEDNEYADKTCYRNLVCCASGIHRKIDLPAI